MTSLEQSKNKLYENPALYFNISKSADTLYEWKPVKTLGTFLLDVEYIKEDQSFEHYFFHLNKGEYRISYLKESGCTYIIGSKNESPVQLSEAIIEHLKKSFHDIYDIEVILSYSGVNPKAFNGFDAEVNDLMNNIEKYQLIREIRIPCRVCGETFKLTLKKNLVEESEVHPIPVVCNHKGHAVLCYIDRQFHCRSTSKVNFAG